METFAPPPAAGTTAKGHAERPGRIAQMSFRHGRIAGICRTSSGVVEGRAADTMTNRARIRTHQLTLLVFPVLGDDEGAGTNFHASRSRPSLRTISRRSARNRRARTVVEALEAPALVFLVTSPRPRCCPVRSQARQGG